MEEFLKSLNDLQLSQFLSILENDIDGDIDYLIFNIKNEINNRNE